MSSEDEAQLATRVPERFEPARMRGQLIEAEHLVRYHWAAGLADGRRVLDAGCGLGYGSALLAAAGAAQVDGIDLAPAVVEAAREEVPSEVRMREGDIGALPYEDDAFDLVVCFEVIEHVEDPARALAELARVLAPGGLLAVSSPNRLAYPPGNPHHAHEYVPDELEQALHEHLAHVRLHRQEGWLAAAVLDEPSAALTDGRRVPDLTVRKVLAGGEDEQTYVLALASDQPLPDSGNTMVLTGLVEVARWLRLFAEQQDALQRQADFLGGTQRWLTELQESRRRLAETEQRLAEARRDDDPFYIPPLEAQRIESLEHAVDERDALRAAVAQLTAENEDLRARLHLPSAVPAPAGAAGPRPLWRRAAGRAARTARGRLG